MSRFGGFVPIRRGIIEHLLDGRLGMLEYLSLLQLILLADSSTGGDRVNAPILRYYCGGYGFNQDTAQRLLTRLHDKGYIWYRPRRFTTVPQAYWINNYALTSGPMKGRTTRLSQLAEKQSISQQDVWRAADQPTDGDAYGGAYYYKKETKEKKQKTKPKPTPGKSASASDSMNDSMSNSTQRTKRSSLSVGECASLSASSDASLSASSVPRTDVPIGQHTAAPKWEKWGDPIPGCRLIHTGESPGYIDIASGKRIATIEEAQRLAELLEQPKSE